MPLQSQGCLEAGVGPGEVQERTGTERRSVGVEGVGQVRRLGLARQLGRQVWRLLQGSRSGK